MAVRLAGGWARDRDRHSVQPRLRSPRLPAGGAWAGWAGCEAEAEDEAEEASRGALRAMASSMRCRRRAKLRGAAAVGLRRAGVSRGPGTRAAAHAKWTDLARVLGFLAPLTRSKVQGRFWWRHQLHLAPVSDASHWIYGGRGVSAEAQERERRRERGGRGRRGRCGGGDGRGGRRRGRRRPRSSSAASGDWAWGSQGWRRRREAPRGRQTHAPCACGTSRRLASWAPWLQRRGRGSGAGSFYVSGMRRRGRARGLPWHARTERQEATSRGCSEVEGRRCGRRCGRRWAGATQRRGASGRRRRLGPDMKDRGQPWGAAGIDGCAGDVEAKANAVGGRPGWAVAG